MSRFSKPLAALSALTAGALLLTGCSGAASSEGAESQTVPLAVGITPIANAAHVYIAEEQGFFEEEGLDVTPTTIQTAATAIPSLFNDELQIALMASVPTVTAASKGLPIKVVGGSDRYPQDAKNDTTALIASADGGVESLKDLAGKTVAVVGLKSTPELALRVLLKNAGVDPDGVKTVEIGYPDMVPALETNRVDAAFIVDPFLSKAKSAGLELLGHPFTDGIGGMTALQWVASDAFTKEQPETIQKFTRAMDRAGKYANDNPEAIREALPKFTALTPELVKSSVLPVYDSALQTDDIQAFVELMTEEGFIDDGYNPEDLIWSAK
ncbi:ABC transporter substrate-binding protein [Arthrobacter sp. MYb222]|uniref:ABC transporter substrate-binding protein n=1 Tax=Arthrobacter sp. MYb222 TaxID=1848599 RepID=UPI000CFB8561|nr:ABC transporter substrate-binding protein [Arthrobacter sp. MYb222]PQZ85207.1 hypothetical protein CQ016_14250 [Arthrobacter sp. MYb222]